MMGRNVFKAPLLTYQNKKIRSGGESTSRRGCKGIVYINRRGGRFNFRAEKKGQAGKKITRWTGLWGKKKNPPQKAIGNKKKKGFFAGRTKNIQSPFKKGIDEGVMERKKARIRMVNVF